MGDDCPGLLKLELDGWVGGRVEWYWEYGWDAGHWVGDIFGMLANRTS